jgi:hypothetical protein
MYVCANGNIFDSYEDAREYYETDFDYTTDSDLMMITVEINDWRDKYATGATNVS